MSVPNQSIVKIAPREIFDQKHGFSRIHLDALQTATTLLKGEHLKLWLYLCSNADGYQLELSQKACLEWGIKKDAYYAAKAKLIELGYLTPIQEGSNILIFSEKPNDSEKPNGNSFSEKPTTFSEKPKEFSEFQKDLSEKPERNTITQYNTIIHNNNTMAATSCDKFEEARTIGDQDSIIKDAIHRKLKNKEQLTPEEAALIGFKF